jgi:alkanesulfonate monooxygenase SsuD/methylene tetrahydromethanopterin reductase-like flavin-dependent oxidoreductase (luciferase family)
VPVRRRKPGRVIGFVRELTESNGRGPDAVRFFAGLNVIVGETEADARRKLEEILRYRDTIGYLVHFGGGSGIDLAALGTEEYIEFKARGHEELSVRLPPKHGVPVHTVPFDLTAAESPAPGLR